MSIDSLSFTLRLVETHEDMAEGLLLFVPWATAITVPALREHMALPDADRPVPC